MVVTCPWCGITFKRTHDRGSYCSRACVYAARRRPDASPVYFLTCRQCARRFASQRNGRRYCSKRCGDQLRYPRYLAQPRPATCITCEATYTQAHGNSPRCETCTTARADGTRHAAKARRRTRQRTNGPWEPVSRQAIYERDSWICYLCGQHVSPEAATTDPLYPTLDHVVPLALGGAHSADNLRLACRACNLAKGASLIESMQLDGERAP